MTASLLLGVFLGLLIAITGFLISSTLSQRPTRNDPQPEKALLETVQQKPTPEGFLTTCDKPELEERQSQDGLSSDSIQPINSNAPENVTRGISAPSHTGEPCGRPICFRITGVPSQWDKNKLGAKLAEIVPGLDLEYDELSMFRACTRSAKTKIALLRLYRTTTYFEGCKQSHEKNYKFPEQCGTVRLNIDKNFYGLTPLNDPDTSITADIIAITGLAGHAFGLWQNRETHAMWLYDFLPQHFRSARIMTYGYNSNLLEPNGARLTDHKKRFLQELSNARTDCPKRPIVFIGHSLGGILVAQAMLDSFCSDRDMPPRDIFDAVRGIFFFGTPHQGLNVEDLKEMVRMQTEKDNYELSQLLDQLNDDSEYLVNQSEACRSMWEHFTGKICSFCETNKTETIERIGDTVQRGGVKVQKVKRFSATLRIKQENVVPIISNHTDMVKFAKEEGEFHTVVEYMNGWLAETSRAALETLIGRVKPEEFFRHYSPVDQKRYIDRILDSYPYDKDEKFFWIFQNMDYNEWKLNLRTLVLSAPPERKLEQAACHIISQLRETSTSTVPLYFFFRRAAGCKRPAWKSVGRHEELIANSVHTCLWQLINVPDYPRTGPQAILMAFLNQLLLFRPENELPKVLTDPPVDNLKSLIDLATLGNLWVAFERALETAFEVWTSDIPPECVAQRARTESQRSNGSLHLILVFDLNSQPAETWELLLGYMRTLQQDFPMIKLVVTNAPRRVNLGLEESQSEIHINCDEERQACLRSLRFDNVRYHNIAIHHEETLEWFLKCDKYIAWDSSDHSSMLFIEGKPGSGKSTLLRFLKSKFVKGRHGPKLDIIADFFYSSRDGELHRSHDTMLRTLLYNILKKDESCFVHFQKKYRSLSQPSSDVVTKWPYRILMNILTACSKHKLRSRLVLIVDALDESKDSDRPQIVKLLWNLAATNGNCVKICLASRPINGLPKESFDSDSGCYRLLLQEENKQDIEKYTKGFLDDLHQLDRESKAEAQKYILEYAEGVFVWVHLIEKDLRRHSEDGCNQAKLIEILKTLPIDLKTYYESMLDDMERNEEFYIENGKRILQFCLFTHRPINLVELRLALAISDGQEFNPTQNKLERRISLNIQALITKATRHFVQTETIPGYDNLGTTEIVQVMHQTVREFFLHPHDAVIRSSFKIVSDEQQALMMIRITCIRYLNLHCEEVISNSKLLASDWSSEDFHEFIRYLETRPFLKYSLEFLTLPESVSDPDIQQFLLDLSINLQECPPSAAFCLLKRLINSSTDVDNVQRQVNHMLGVAAEEGCVVAVGNLLAASAECGSVDKHKRTPLHFAAENGHEAVVRLLLDHGANTEAQTSRFGSTALHLASDNGHEAILQLLLEHNGDKEAKDNSGGTAIHCAAESGHAAVVQLLLGHNANKEAKNIYGRRALHFAADNGHYAVARLLAYQGANVSAADKDGWTPLQLAQDQGYDAVVRLLASFTQETENKPDSGSPQFSPPEGFEICFCCNRSSRISHAARPWFLNRQPSCPECNHWPCSECAYEKRTSPIDNPGQEDSIRNTLRSVTDGVDPNQFLEILSAVDQAKFISTIKPADCDQPKFYWLFKNIDYTQWCVSDSQVLWLSGPSQCGIDQFSSHIVNSKSSERQHSVLYFFCSTAAGSESISTVFARALLHQMVKYVPPLKKKPVIATFLSALYDTILARAQAVDPDLWQLKEDNLAKKILDMSCGSEHWCALKAVLELEQNRDLIIIIDGLDKVEKQKSEFIRKVCTFIARLQERTCKINVLLTSRPEDDIGALLGGILSIEYDKERKECLNTLRFDNTRYDRISNEHEGSFQWLWNHEQYRAWSSTDTSDFLLIEGKPGSGKSTITKYFKRNLMDQRNLMDRGPLSRQSVVASFFYSYRDGEQHTNHCNMLRSILYDVLMQKETFFFHFQSYYRQAIQPGTRFQWPYNSLREILHSIGDHPAEERVYIILDAMDESEDTNRRDILRLLCQLCSTDSKKPCNMKILLASRPIASLMYHTAQLAKVIRLQDVNEFDILKFTQSFLGSEIKLPPDILQRAADYIVRDAQGVIVWVQLVRQQLLTYAEQGLTPENILVILKTLPTTLDEFYNLMLTRLEQSETQDINDGLKMFRLVLFAFRPLRLAEFHHALAIADDFDAEFSPSDESFEDELSLDINKHIIHFGGGFLEVQGGSENTSVQLIHPTVHEFFLSYCAAPMSMFSMSRKESHTKISLICLRYLILCATNTKLQNELPKNADSWNTEHFEAYAQYLKDRPFINYVLSNLKRHMDDCAHEGNVSSFVSQLAGRLTASPAFYLLEGWVDSHLNITLPGHERSGPGSPEDFKKQLLHTATRMGFPQVVEVLLMCGAEVDARFEGKTPLIVSAERGDDITVRLLIDWGANENAKDDTGETAVHHAAKNGHESTVQLFVRTSGAGEQAQDDMRGPPSPFRLN